MVAPPLPARPDPGSFRDRDNVVVRDGARVFRGLSPSAWERFEALARTRFFPELVAGAKLVPTSRAPGPPPCEIASADGSPFAGWLEHERVPFVSYPYEWCFSALRTSASLHLEILERALAEDWWLKDATPYNVQWRGVAPVFIDVGSFEPWPVGSPWTAYRQFCQLHLFPLLLAAHKGVAFQPWLRGSLDGIEPAAMRALCSLRDLVRPGVLGHVVLHAALERRQRASTSEVRARVRDLGFGKDMLLHNVRKLRKLVDSLHPPSKSSAWVGYAANTTYSQTGRDQKHAFVRAALAGRRRELVWDLGSNTGEYSRLAAESATTVVALDSDRDSIEQLFVELSRSGPRNVLPLTMSLTDPSPGLGWRGAERGDLASRGRPDLVLALALVHHVVIGGHVPLPQFVEWLASLDADLVFEFVERSDPMVVALLRDKGEPYADYDRALFETCASRWFEPVGRRELEEGRRTLYHLRRRG